MLIKWNNRLRIGDTINIFSANKESPFTTESCDLYESLWKQKEISDDTDDTDAGVFTYNSRLFFEYSSFAKSLTIGGSIGADLGIVGAEASVQWKEKENTNSRDIRFLVKANYKGKTIKNAKYSQQLKLNIDWNSLTFEEFKDKYGSHIIIGIRYGSKATYKVTYKYDRQYNYDYFSAKVKAKILFVTCTVLSIHNCKEKKEMTIDSDWTYEYEPQTILSGNNELVNEIHEYFSNNLKIIKTSKQAKQVKQVQQLSTTSNINLMNNIHRLLCQHSKPIEFIAIPIEMVECVNNAFIINKQSRISTTRNLIAFRQLINELFFTLEQFKHDLRANEAQIAMRIAQKWDKNIDKKLLELQQITTTRKDVDAFIIEWKAFLKTDLNIKYNYNEITDEIEKPIYAINNMKLKNQFYRSTQIR